MPLQVWRAKCTYIHRPEGSTRGHSESGGTTMAKTGTVLKKGKRLAAAKSLMATVSLRKA